MTQQHPVPPPELVQQWAQLPDDWNTVAFHIAQWGADQELEACLCEVSFLNNQALADCVRAARRPKPTSLKEQALAALNEIEDRYAGPSTEEILIRRALEQLDD